MDLIEKEETRLDFRGMHSQLVKENRGYKEQENAVLLFTKSLEMSINNLLNSLVKKSKNRNQKKFPNSKTPISSKIKWLLSEKIISKQLYKNLTILFRVRNKFAHVLMISRKDTVNVFVPLKDVRINDKFVETLPNDSVKFQLVCSQCYAELLSISEKVDPSSVLRLTLDGPITPIED